MQTLLREFKFYFFQFCQNLKNQSALRGSSWVLAISIILSNTPFFVVWLLFSRMTGPIHGWGMLQTFGMLSMAIFIFGLGTLLFGSVGTMQPHVQTGSFDIFLTKPKNLYVRIINNQALPTAIGEVIQGGVGVLIYLWLAKPTWVLILMFAALIPPAVLVQISFMITCDCIIFWLPYAQGLGKALKELIILPTAQPTSLLQGGIRIMYLTIVPALLVAGVPIEVMTFHSYKLIAVSYTVSLIWLAISVWCLNQSVRRYESGNVIG